MTHVPRMPMSHVELWWAGEQKYKWKYIYGMVPRAGRPVRHIICHHILHDEHDMAMHYDRNITKRKRASLKPAHLLPTEGVTKDFSNGFGEQFFLN